SRRRGRFWDRGRDRACPCPHGRFVRGLRSGRSRRASPQPCQNALIWREATHSRPFQRRLVFDCHQPEGVVWLPTDAEPPSVLLIIYSEADVHVGDLAMAWFALARVLFVVAVAYAAAILQPLAVGLPVNVGFALALAALVVLFETRLRETAVTRVLGALIGCAIGLGIAHAIVTSLFWADSGDRKVEFLHSFTLIVLPYLGLVLGGKHGEWLEPARLVTLFRAAGPLRRYKILDTSVIIDGRIADVCETGFVDGTLVIPQFVLK